MTHRHWTIAVAATALALAACGTDRGAREGTGLYKLAYQAVRAKVARTPATGAAQPVDPAAMAASAKRTVKGSILIAQIEDLGTTSVLGQIGENGALRTYATPSQQTMLMKGGVLVGTRGLGHDLMSADADAAIRVIRARGSGQVTRVWRFLDGEGIERPLPMDCVIGTAGSKALAIAGSSYSTTQVGERCRRGSLTVDNAYWVTGDGSIVMSYQWIGPELGHASIQLVRP